jgi:class 3 adenylate cyclase
MGSTLNLASRLEGIAKKDEIIVSRKLKDMIQGQYNFTPVSVKRREKDGIKSFKREKVVYAIKGKKRFRRIVQVVCQLSDDKTS